MTPRSTPRLMPPGSTRRRPALQAGSRLRSSRELDALAGHFEPGHEDGNGSSVDPETRPSKASRPTQWHGRTTSRQAQAGISGQAEAAKTAARKRNLTLRRRYTKARLRRWQVFLGANKPLIPTSLPLAGPSSRRRGFAPLPCVLSFAIGDLFWRLESPLMFIAPYTPKPDSTLSSKSRPFPLSAPSAPKTSPRYLQRPRPSPEDAHRYRPTRSRTIPMRDRRSARLAVH